MNLMDRSLKPGQIDALGPERGRLRRRVGGLVRDCQRIRRASRQLAAIDAWVDRVIVDGLINSLASVTWNSGLRLRQIQTGRLRQYVMFIVVGTVAIFLLASMLFSTTVASP